MQRLAPFLAVTLFGLPAAHAFGEDLCYGDDGVTVVSCGPLAAVCQPVPTSTDACKQAMFQEDANATSGIYRSGRSSVHVDSTFLIAQALGFSATDAYWIAAYDGAVDNGTFVLRDNTSVAVGSGEYATATFSGITRGDLSSGGVLLHFIAPYNHGTQMPIATINGLVPDPTDAATEPTLAHYRGWAQTGTLACMAGLTAKSAAGDFGTGATCFFPGTTVHGSISAIGSAAVPFMPSTGYQILQDPTNGPQVLSTKFAALVAHDGAMTSDPTHLADARLGIYLHVLADRITHHECTDKTVISGPTAAGWTVDLTNDQCVAGWHFLHHAWETGVDFSLVPAADRTTEAALSIVYDELATFAAARGLAPVRGIAKATLLASLATSLEQVQAIDRVNAVDAVGCAAHLAAFPGQPACSASAPDDEVAGSDGPPAAANSGGCQTTSPSGTLPAAGVGLAILFARRRRRAVAR
jgi:uncharacterized protein (TIGR03382 family)